jgi:hypothetical protein
MLLTLIMVGNDQFANGKETGGIYSVASQAGERQVNEFLMF